MKKKTIIAALILGCGLGMTTTSCEDMLSADSDRVNHTNANDTLYGYWGIMKAVQNISERYVILGEARGDLITTTSATSDTISRIANFENPVDGECRYVNVRDYYKVINECNNWLATADTMATTTGDKKMLKEYAQVSIIRAWTYMQLVNNYGKVPYYTDPITSLDYIDKFEKNPVYIDKDNMVEKLIPTIERFKYVPMPVYGNYNNGAVSINSKLTMFPLQLVMGDIYLTASQYVDAATCYYDYLKENNAYLPVLKTSPSEMIIGSTKEFMYDGPQWLSSFSYVSAPGNSADPITVVPSAASKLDGHVLTGVSNVFGGVTTQSVTSGSDNDDENQSASNTASVSVTWDATARQLAPSAQYFTINKAQDYIRENNADRNNPILEIWDEAGDARQCAINRMENLPYVQKQSVKGAFSFTYPVLYRKSLVWLRFAEAINRAGFPSYAFAILKDGLCDEYLPKIVKEEVTNDKGDSIGIKEVYDTVGVNCYYIPRSEYDAAQSVSYLKFGREFTNVIDNKPANIGVHARGCGITEGLRDTLFYTYRGEVNKRLAMKSPNLTFDNATQKELIDAVENIIVDELALETAFEGNRFTDLIRIANHKNLVEEGTGTAWFADKIARRGAVDQETKPADYDRLYNKLIDPKNWYFTLPSFK